ncbi:MAG: hypothetical protein ACPGQD_09350, partial [Planctomycetota bacterium]
MIRRLPVFLPALAMALLPACSSPQKQLSVEELATAIALIEAGEDERAYKMLDDYQVEDFDLPTQRDYNLMVARLADRIGKWSAAMKYYE